MINSHVLRSLPCSATSSAATGMVRVPI